MSAPVKAAPHSSPPASPERPSRLLRSLKLVGRPLLRILFTVDYRGVRNVPPEGAVIIAGNHPSYLDPALVALPIDRVIRFMAWDALFRVPLLGRLIEKLGAFPVDLARGRGESAYREGLRVLGSGQALGIFPEGQRSEAGPMGELKTGVARLAIETGAPIVPVTIAGAYRAWPRWRLLPRPAKIIVRFHQPIVLDEEERQRRRGEREYQQEIMTELASRINRSLGPGLRTAEGWERWYRQPPPHIRTYEWAPLAAVIAGLFVLGSRGLLGTGWPALVIPAAVYYLYLIADLTLIKPSRGAKWLRNSAPVWLILIWHRLLVEAAALPLGEMNAVAVAGGLAAFSTYFWEDYYTMQKFVRGVVVAYYVSLLLLVWWPEPLGTLVATMGFIFAFSLWYRTVYYRLICIMMTALIAAAVVLKGGASPGLLIFAALAVATLAYVHTFASAAYDIRRGGIVTDER